MSNFIISLDFELFWGVSDSRTIADYGKNIEGVWDAIPKMLELFKKYDIHATWATVGMLMCRDYKHWQQIRPDILPSYANQKYSNYALDAEIIKRYPNLFFARSLVEQIQNTPHQEIATHTYSHFYCGVAGVTVEQFKQDLICAQHIATEMDISFESIVFPGNLIKDEFLQRLPALGIKAYRGEQNYWPCPRTLPGRAIRFADAWLPLTRNPTIQNINPTELVNIPASRFLRPCPLRFKAFESLRLKRLKIALSEAARSSNTLHLWWHPHNFGVNLSENLTFLESLLQHYQFLQNRYGMKSLSMAEFAQLSVD